MSRTGRPPTPVSEDQKMEIARLLGQDKSLREISKEVGLSYDVTKRVARTTEVVAAALMYRQEYIRQLIQDSLEEASAILESLVAMDDKSDG